MITLGFVYNTQLKTKLFHEAFAINYTISFTTFMHIKAISATLVTLLFLLVYNPVFYNKE